jgi:hypothetical protein
MYNNFKETMALNKNTLFPPSSIDAICIDKKAWWNTRRDLEARIKNLIEDLNDQAVFKRVIKQKANMLLQEIQRVDATILEGGNMDIFQQQIEIQQSFRQWVEQNF